MRLLFLLLLASPDLSGQLGEYLRAAPGSEPETKALAAIRVYWDADPAAVEEALRRHVTFPARETGLAKIEFPLPGENEGNPAALYLPKAYDPAKRWPVLLVVHGTSGYADADVGELRPFAERHGVVLLGPQDTIRKGGGGWGHSDHEQAIHAEAIRWLKRNVNVDDARVFVTGGSRGGHAAWDLGYTYPDLFAGAIPVVGGPRDRYFRFLENLLHVPVLDLQGAKDQAGLVENVKDAVELLKSWDYDVTYEEDESAGHYFPVDWEEVWDWMKDRRRPSYPKRVIRSAMRNDRARAYWIRLSGLDERKLTGVKETRIQPRATPTREELKKLVRDTYASYRGRVEAVVEDRSTVSLAVSRTPTVTVWLHDRLVDLTGKVTIEVNGRVRLRRVFTSSLEALLARVKETGDRELLYPVSVEVRGAR